MRVTPSLCACLALLASTPARAAQSSDQVYEVAFAPLEPSERQYAHLGPAGPYFPEGAYEAGVSGEAILRCQAQAGGVLKRCQPVSDSPGRWGFAIAARIMADRGRITAVGSPSDGQTIEVHVPFTLAPAAHAKP